MTEQPFSGKVAASSEVDRCVETHVLDAVENRCGGTINLGWTALRVGTASRTCVSTHLSTSELAATLPLKGCSVMEKAHLYEALYLVNHGIDEAVRGVQRLKKSPKLFMETYHKSMAGL